jgi:hypothetical protein
MKNSPHALERALAPVKKLREDRFEFKSTLEESLDALLRSLPVTSGSREDLFEPRACGELFFDVRRSFFAARKEAEGDLFGAKAGRFLSEASLRGLLHALRGLLHALL